MKDDSSKKRVMITDECNVAIRQFLNERIGILIHSHQEESLGKYISQACQEKGFNTCDEYIETLRKSSTQSDIVEDLIDAVTVDESYFFRDEKQMQFLQADYFPQRIAMRRKQGLKTLRVWSAGCSNGQEIYTIAIMLHEMLPDFHQWNLHLLGTDLNIRSIAQARKAIYRKLSFRAISENLIKKYFEQDDHTFKLHSDLAKIVKYNYLNLVEDVYPSLMTETNDLDLILCRNVFIYFSPEQIKKTLLRFSHCLLPGAALLLGPSDIFQEKIPTLNKVQRHGIFFYERPLQIETPETPTVAPATKKPTIKTTPQTTTQTIEPQSIKIDDTAFKTCLYAEQWEDLLRITTQALEKDPNHTALLLYKAKALANLGQLNEAAKICDKCIQINKLLEKPYLLKALIASEHNDLKLAQQCLEKAIFLNPDYIEAHYQLGLLWLRQGKERKGVHALQLALKKLEKADSNQAVDNAPASTLGQLADALKNEIRSIEQAR